MDMQPLIQWTAGQGVAQSRTRRVTLARKPDLGFAFDDLFFNTGSGVLRLGADEAHDLTADQVAACEAFIATLTAFRDVTLVFAVDAAGAPLGYVEQGSAGIAAVVPPAPDGSDWRWDFGTQRWLRPQDLAALRAAALETVDAEAEAARLRFISGGAGMAATYLIKGEQAAAFINDGYQGPVPPFIAAEAQATGLSPADCADQIHALATQWRDVLAPAIEGARRAAKIGIEAAPDAAGINATLHAGIATMRAFQP